MDRPVAAFTVSTTPIGPQVVKAWLMRFRKGARRGQRMSTTRSRGNDSIEIDFVVGSARTSMIVSERDAPPASGPLKRLSYPITSAVAGFPAVGTASFVCAI